MGIRRAGDTLGCNTRIDAAGKIGIFHHPTGFAWIIVQPFSFAGTLHPAIVHLKDEAVRTLLNDLLRIYPGIDTENKGLL